MIRLHKRFPRGRTLLSLALLGATVLLSGCYAYPAYPGYAYGGPYGGYPAYGYPAGYVAVGGGGYYGGGWHGGWWLARRRRWVEPLTPTATQTAAPCHDDYGTAQLVAAP